MPRLDKTVDEALEILKQEVHRQSKKNKSDFMGKKIVSASQWGKMLKTHTRDEMLEFIPEEYVEYPFGFIDCVFLMGKKYLDWNYIWQEFFISKKDPVFGKRRCHGCILNEDPDRSLWDFTYPSSTSIRNIILKHSKVNGIEFGCPVNVFRCPYKQLQENDDLFELANIWRITHDAIWEAWNRTHYNHGKFFEIDFVRGVVFEQRDWYVEPEIQLINNSLIHHNLSIVPVNCIKDIFDILTDSILLGSVIDQYIEQITNEDMEYTGKIRPESKIKAERIREYKDGIVRFFSEIKDQIKLDEIRNLHDQTIEDEEREKNRLEEVYARFVKDKPELEEYFRKQRIGNCSCSKFSNIHCLNCNTWVCDKHWKEHGKTHHNLD